MLLEAKMSFSSKYTIHGWLCDLKVVHTFTHRVINQPYEYVGAISGTSEKNKSRHLCKQPIGGTPIELRTIQICSNLAVQALKAR